MQKVGVGLRIGLNGLFWSQERTGSGQYTRHLWQELDRSGPDEYHLLSFDSNLKDLSATDLRTIAVPKLVQRGGENITKVWWEQAGLPQLMKQAAQTGNGYDVLHYPYFAAPLAKLPPHTGLVVTIHDLIPLALPEYAPSLSLKLYFRLVSTAARRANLILTDSEHSKRDILRFLKVPSRKVQVVYLGVDERYYAEPKSPAEERRALFQRYGLNGDERIIFYLGGFDRRKNLITLIEAFAKALPHLKQAEAADQGGRWVLALGGKPHTDNPIMYPDLKGPIARLFGTGDEAGRVCFLGPVTEADKPLLYRAADLYAFPSLYEGFGLDPLEALASGAPVICSDATSLSEIVGQAGRLIAPLDVNAWAETIVELTSNPAKRAALSEAGPIQATRFTWQKMAERTLQLYNVVECIETRGRD